MVTGRESIDFLFRTITMNTNSQKISYSFVSPSLTTFCFRGGKNYEEDYLFDLRSTDVEPLSFTVAVNDIEYTLSNEDKPYTLWKNKSLYVYFGAPPNKFFKHYQIFSPTIPALTYMNEDMRMEVLDGDGTGLIYLICVTSEEGKEVEIFESLKVVGFYDEVDFTRTKLAYNRTLKRMIFIDKSSGVVYNQKSVSSSYLFCLFYLTLMVSEHTPKVFAIENLASTLSQKQASLLMGELIRLGAKYDKQVFVTINNQTILDDGLLADEEYRVFEICKDEKHGTYYNIVR